VKAPLFLSLRKGNNMPNTHDYILVKLDNKEMIVDNIDDLLFAKGWRFVRYVKNSEIDWNTFWTDENQRYENRKNM
jgi:hypothetical protein